MDSKLQLLACKWHTHIQADIYNLKKSLKCEKLKLNRRESNFALEEISKVHLSDEFENVKQKKRDAGKTRDWLRLAHKGRLETANDLVTVVTLGATIISSRKLHVVWTQKTIQPTTPHEREEGKVSTH